MPPFFVYHNINEYVVNERKYFFPLDFFKNSFIIFPLGL